MMRQCCDNKAYLFLKSVQSSYGAKASSIVLSRVVLLRIDPASRFRVSDHLIKGHPLRRCPSLGYLCPRPVVHSDCDSLIFIFELSSHSNILHSSLGPDFSVLYTIFQRNVQQASFHSSLANLFDCLPVRDQVWALNVRTGNMQVLSTSLLMFMDKSFF